MTDLIRVTGMVLSARPIGDYDNRIVVLSRERGKISVFAKGAKRPKSRFSAVGPFSYGQFEMRESASSYTLCSVDIDNYFEALRTDIEGACYGMYALEVADYFGRENNDEWENLKLLYTTIRALERNVCDRRLIRSIYELRTLSNNGFAPRLEKMELDRFTRYAMQYAMEAPYRQLYAAAVQEETLGRLQQESRILLRTVLDRPIKSEEMLELLVKEKTDAC